MISETATPEIALELRREDGVERQIGGLRFEDGIFAPVGSAFGGARGFRVGEILDQQFGARALRFHAGGADGNVRRTGSSAFPP